MMGEPAWPLDMTPDEFIGHARVLHAAKLQSIGALNRFQQQCPVDAPAATQPEYVLIYNTYRTAWHQMECYHHELMRRLDRLPMTTLLERWKTHTEAKRPEMAREYRQPIMRQLFGIFNDVHAEWEPALLAPAMWDRLRHLDFNGMLADVEHFNAFLSDHAAYRNKFMLHTERIPDYINRLKVLRNAVSDYENERALALAQGLHSRSSPLHQLHEDTLRQILAISEAKPSLHP
jgi:hypothetical protein